MYLENKADLRLLPYNALWIALHVLCILGPVACLLRGLCLLGLWCRCLIDELLQYFGQTGRKFQRI